MKLAHRVLSVVLNARIINSGHLVSVIDSNGIQIEQCSFFNPLASFDNSNSSRHVELYILLARYTGMCQKEINSILCEKCLQKYSIRKGLLKSSIYFRLQYVPKYYIHLDTVLFYANEFCIFLKRRYVFEANKNLVQARIFAHHKYND